MKKTDLLELLETQLAETEKYLASFYGDNNQQIVLMYRELIGKRDILQATIHYIKTGSKSYF